MSRALSFMADPALAASVLPGPGEGFGIPAFLAQAGTVYMIAEAISEEAPVAPLLRHGHRDPLCRRADGPGLGGPASGSAAFDGPGYLKP